MEKKSDEPLWGVYSPKTLYEMSWTEVADALKETDIIILPIGSVENHGPHLPLGTDSLKVAYQAQKVAEKCAKEGIKVLVAPLIPFGIAPHHMGFPGSITLESETLISLICDVAESLIHHGFKNVIILNGHGGNDHQVGVAALKVAKKTGANVVYIKAPEHNWFYGELSSSEKPYMGGELHGGEHETAKMLAAFPNLVMMDKAVKYFSPTGEKIFKGWPAPVAGVDYMPQVVTGEGWKKVSPTVGSGGDPFSATVEKGKLSFDFVANFVCEYIKNYIKKKS